MRLIDADAFKDSVAKEVITDLGNVSILTIGKALGRTPTVDAIPIEWLKEWARNHLDRIEEYADIVPDIVSDYREEQKGNETTDTGTSVRGNK